MKMIFNFLNEKFESPILPLEMLYVLEKVKLLKSQHRLKSRFKETRLKEKKS
jgi:hypothetical protein